MNYMEISVCLIVKNEEKVLDRCLKCASRLADEIIIVDTGSKDKTKKIALSYTPFVYDYKWNNDFSMARNFALSKGTKDYLMWLDADDIILDEEIEKIISLKNEKNPADLYMLKYEIDGEFNFYFYRERIFKKSLGYKFVGFVHEVIVPFGKIEYLDIKITHKKEGSSGKRNLNIYRRHLPALSVRDTYYYGKELFYNGYYLKSIKILKEFLKFEKSLLANKKDATLTIAKCHIERKEFNKALNFLRKNDSYLSKEYLFLMGLTFKSIKKLKLAIIFFKASLEFTDDIDLLSFTSEYETYFCPKLELLVCYFELGEFEKAKNIHFELKEKYPSNKILLYNDRFFK